MPRTRSTALLLLALLLSLMPMLSLPTRAETPPGPHEAGRHNIVRTAGTSPAAARRAAVARTATPARAAGLPTEAATITPEIEALARGLSHDPRLIFNFVHNTIDFVPIFGTLNGATGTARAGRGTDADQAALFIALMRACGYTARYVVGDVTYTPAQLANWVGSTPAQAGNVLINGGIPIAPAAEGNIQITRVWAEAEIGGTTYTFDPAMKTYTETTGLADLGAALSYDRATFLTHAAAGATVDADAVQDLNEANIRADLTAYAMALVDTINTDLPDGGVADVIGGRRIVQTEPTAYATQLPHALATANLSRPADLAAYRHTLRVAHAGIDTTFATLQLAGKRVTLTYDTSDGNKPVLRVDGETIATGTTTALGASEPMTLTVDHPYDGYDQTATFNMESGGTYAILHDFNTVSDAVISAANTRLAQAIDDGLDDEDEPVLGEALSLMGLRWLQQVHRFADLAGRVGNVITLSHHEVGVMGQEEGTFIDVPMGMVSTVSTDGASDSWAVFRAQTLMGSAFEHGILEQILGTPSASTIKLLTLNNTNGDTTFVADKGNWTTVKPQLQDYSAGQLAQLEAAVNADHSLVLPEHGDITLNQWRGTGYIDDWQSADGTAGSIGMIISGGYSGGYATITGTVQVRDVVTATWLPPADLVPEIETPEDSDPIDMATGAFHQTHLDLSVGLPEPLGLHFARMYNSGAALSAGPLGYGWRHTYEADLTTQSDTGAGLGARGAHDAAALIAYAHVAVDLLDSDDHPFGADRWLTTGLATRWAMDQLTDNVAVVRLGHDVLRYTRLPDGTFAPPPGSARDLKPMGAGLALQGTGNDALVFDATGRAEAWIDANGNALRFSYDGDGALHQLATTTGVTLALAYDAGALATVTDQTGRAITFTYNTDGELSSATNALGNTWAYGYDDAHRLATVTRPKGNTVATNGYDAWGRVITQTDALGNTTTFGYSGYRTALTNAQGAVTGYFFAADGRMTAREDGAGNRFTLTTNGLGQRATVTDRMGDTTTLTYDPQSHTIATITNGAGERTTNTTTAQTLSFTHPDAPGQSVTFTRHSLTRVDYPDGTDERFTYDTVGNLKTQTDQASGTWTYTTNGLGRVQTVTNPKGGVTAYTYSPDGALATQTDSDTGTTTYTVDAALRTIRITDPDGGTVRTTYDAGDRPTTMTDANGRTITMSYDVNDNLTQVIDPTGATATYSYDAMDRVTAITDPLGKITTFAYDGLGQTTAITDPTKLAVTFGYDARGWATTSTLGGATWEQAHDDEHMPTASTTPLGHTTTLGTDALGHATSITNPLGQTGTLTRDAVGRVTGATDALGHATAYTYEARGLLSSVTLPTNAAAALTWDTLGNLATITDLNGETWTLGTTTMGRTTSLTDPQGNVWQHTRDALGRLDVTTYPDTGTLDRSYDAAGNVTARSYSDGLTIATTYDALDRLATTNGLTLTRDAAGQVTSTRTPSAVYGATYDDGGRLKTVTYDDGALTVTYSYDPVTGLLSRVTDSLTGASVGFTYDADRRLTGLARSNDVDGAYTYDAAGRLTRIQEGDILDLAYTLDAAGQVTQASLTMPIDPVEALTARTDALTYDAASQVNTTGYAYDARGRMTASPDHTFSWDGASRLTGVDGATLSYNGLGALTARTSAGAGRTYDTHLALDLAPIVAERDAQSDDVRRFYVWTPGGKLLYAIDTADGNGVSFYHFDRTGSTLALTAAGGDLTDAYAYLPYGELLRHDGASDQPFTYIGQWGVRQEGADGDLYAMRARVYDAQTTQFLSRDPAWPDLRHATALNPYDYAMRNPLSYIDPLGTKGLLSALIQELLGIDMPPTSPVDLIYDIVVSPTPLGYEKDPEWGYGWRGQFMTKEQREAWDRQQAAEAQRRQEAAEKRRLQEWLDERQRKWENYLSRQAAHQARVAAREFGGNREALLKSIEGGGVWIRQGNHWLYFTDAKKWGTNFDGGVWVHVERQGEIIGIAGDELVADGHISDRQQEHGW